MAEQAVPAAWELLQAASAMTLLTAFEVVEVTITLFIDTRWPAFGATASQRNFALGAWVVAGFVTLVATERVADRVDGRCILAVASVIAVGATVGLALTRSTLVASVMVTLIGGCAATFHPLTKARAYASLPGRPGIVNALATALTVVDLTSPVVFGLVAAHTGSAGAMLALLAAPIVVGLGSLLSLRGRKSRPASEEKN